MLWHNVYAQIDVSQGGFKISAIDSAKVELPKDARLKLSPIAGLSNKNIRPKINFTELSDEEYYECLRWANSELMKNYYDKQKKRTLEQIDHLYTNKDTSFREFDFSIRMYPFRF